MKLSLAHPVSYRPRRLVAPHQGVHAIAYKPIQFRQSMSLPAFLQSFGTEAACAEAVRRARWPGGFACRRCNEGAHCVVVSGNRRLSQCHACHRQTSLTAGSLFGWRRARTCAATAWHVLRW